PVGKPPTRLAVDCDEDVAWLSGVWIHAAQARALGGRARGGSDDDDALHARARRRGLAGGNDADARRRYGAFADELGHDAIDRIDRYGEADARAGPGRGKNRGVDADHSSRRTFPG